MDKHSCVPWPELQCYNETAHERGYPRMLNLHGSDDTYLHQPHCSTADEVPKDEDYVYVSTEGDEWIPDKYDYDDEDAADEDAVDSSGATPGSAAGTSAAAASSTSAGTSSDTESGTGTSATSGESSIFTDGSDDDVAATTRTLNGTVVLDESSGAADLARVAWSAAAAFTAVAALVL